MSYTKEPWVVAKGRTHNNNLVIEDSCGECIALVMEGGINDEEDARRIVACVNACAGLPTDLIEKHGVTRSGIAKGVEELEKQRDALLDFANHIATAPQLSGTGWQEMAQMVVASMKGGE